MDNTILYGLGIGVLLFVLMGSKKKGGGLLSAFNPPPGLPPPGPAPTPPAPTPGPAGAWYSQPIILPPGVTLATANTAVENFNSNLLAWDPENRCDVINLVLSWPDNVLKPLALMYYQKYNKSITEELNGLYYACIATNSEGQLINRLSSIGVQ